MKTNMRTYINLSKMIACTDTGWQLHLHHNARQHRRRAEKPGHAASGLGLHHCRHSPRS